jgi:hypothetical protein
MFVFGHIGIGRKLAQPWSRSLPAVPLIVGMLLPDLIDKPLYYARISDFFSCTRTIGHTGVLLAAILLAALFTRSRVLWALGLGVATHLALDCFADLFSSEESSAWIALTWPVLHREFVRYYIPSIQVHFERLWVTPVIVSETVGLALLVWDAWRARQSKETLAVETTRSS